jgi:hypothetical protein
MTTSGNLLFAMSRDDIINAALRAMEVIGAGETASSEDLTNCAQALNIICKAYANKGLPLWCIQDIAVPFIQGQASYVVGPDAVPATPRPVRVLQAYLRRSDGTDVPLTIISREEYNNLSSKSMQAQTTQLYYDAQLGNGVVTVYGVPPDSTGTLHLLAQRQVQDFNLGTDNPDFPQEAYQMLKWKLIDEIALEYGVKVTTIQIAAAKAQGCEMEFGNANQEQTSHYFIPSGHGYGGY